MQTVNVPQSTVAERFSIHRNTMARLRQSGAFPNAFKIGHTWRIPMADVEAYEAQQIAAARAADQSTTSGEARRKAAA